MRCWCEIGNDPCSCLGYFDKGRSERVLGYVPKLSMLTLVGTRIFCMDDAEEFRQACFMTLDNWLRKEEFKSYRYYLYVSLPISNPRSRVARYKKVWKVLQQSWDIQDFILSPEAEIAFDDTLHFAGIAECTLETLPLALTIMTRKRYAFVFASNRNGVIEDAQIELLHHIAFNKSHEYPDDVDTFNLCLHLCPQGDMVFRWGDASEEEQLDLIFAEQ